MSTSPKDESVTPLYWRGRGTPLRLDSARAEQELPGDDQSPAGEPQAAALSSWTFAGRGSRAPRYGNEALPED